MAAEANCSLLRQHAAVILARQAATREVKRRRQKQGQRETLPYSTLSRLAIEHLQTNPQLIDEAAADPPVQILGVPHRNGGREIMHFHCAYLKCNGAGQ
jgi:hypothetical protein